MRYEETIHFVLVTNKKNHMQFYLTLLSQSHTQFINNNIYKR